MRFAWIDMTSAEKSVVVDRLVALGMTHLEIAERYGVKRSTVGQYTSPSTAVGGPGLRVRLRASVIDRLDRAARRRGASLDGLCSDILTAIITDDILDAVLDDGEGA